MKNATAIMVLAIMASAAAAARAAGSAEQPKDVVVLDLGQGSFRAFEAWKTPTLVSPEGKLKPMLEPKRKGLKDEDRKALPVRASSGPAANWIAPGFDDSVWPRVYSLVALNRGTISMTNQGADARYAPNGPLEGNLVCLRGKFTVTDPAQVADLKLSLRYFGGAVVYVNGTELQRGHLPAGTLGPDVLATSYPDDAYVTPDNKARPFGIHEDPKVMAERLKGRLRELPARGCPNGVRIPASLLRKGVNVIAIEVHAAPVAELAVEKVAGGVTWTGDSIWPHAMVVDGKVTSTSAAGLVGNVAATPDIQLSNSQPIESILAYEYTHPADQVYPIRLVGARNGFFSGKVVLSSAGAITKLNAAASDLTRAGGNGSISAAAVQVRFAERTTPRVSWATHWATWGWVYFDRLLSEFPAELPPAADLVARAGPHVRLAVVPIWVTVHVPADALAGEYEGTLTIRAEGKSPVAFKAPVHLKVNDWKIPDPRDFTIHHDIYQSPDSVAKYYDVPLWSEKHFELMGKSLKAFNEVGNRMCILHLGVNARSLGNSESMVRWVRKPDGGYDHDFTIAEKYLDLYERTCGKPGILRMEAWQRALDAKAGDTIKVSVFDPATGKVEATSQPAYGTPENEAFWRPVFTELKKRLQRRGWYDVAAVNWINYSAGPPGGIVDVYKHLWPDGKWMQTSHTNPRSFPGTTKDAASAMPVPYVEYVWGCGRLYNPDAGGQYPRPWKSGVERIELGFPRFGVSFINAIYDHSGLASYKLVTEAALQGNLRGVGYLGGDFWPVTAVNDGRYNSLSYSYNGIAMSDCIRACFSPGPDGAAFNGRMEMFREGVQVGEAIVFLQRALESKKAAGELATRIGDLLDERARYYLRAELPAQVNEWYAFECSNWQERDDRLFALCAEMAAKAGGQ